MSDSLIIQLPAGMCWSSGKIWSADDREKARLDIQHRALKIVQGKKNYVAPMADILNKGTSEERRDRKVLDIGTGSGIW
jgi:tRNA1(Val) A37 N6-methylase TrmN6